MPLYLSRFSYTPETWARLIGNPEDRRTAAQSYIESVGGKLHGALCASAAAATASLALANATKNASPSQSTS
jgi:hypothetical protein